MPRVGFEPTISAGERPQTYALDHAATGAGNKDALWHKMWRKGLIVGIAVYTKYVRGQRVLCTVWKIEWRNRYHKKLESGKAAVWAHICSFFIHDSADYVKKETDSPGEEELTMRGLKVADDVAVCSLTIPSLQKRNTSNSKIL